MKLTIELLQDELIETFRDIEHFEGRVARCNENLGAWWCESQRMQNKYSHKANMMDEIILFLKSKYVSILNDLAQTIN